MTKAWERSRRIRSYWESRAYRRLMRKLYSNRRAMKKMIRKHEDRVAIGLASLDLRSTRHSTGSAALAMDMEMFLSWRLNLGRYACHMWCDGVEDLLITPIDRRAYYVEAKACIYPVLTSDLSDLSEPTSGVEGLWELKGTLILNSRLDKLRSYEIHICDQELVLRCVKGRGGYFRHYIH